MFSRRKVVFFFIILVVVLSFLGCRYFTQEVSLFDLPGTSSNSPRFWMIKRGLNMTEVSVNTLQYEWLKEEFPDATSFYRTGNIPMIIVTKDGVVDAVRIGDRLGFSEDSYLLTPLLIHKICENLARVNVDYPYELMLSENHASAFRLLHLPYWGMPSIQRQGELSIVNFETESRAPYPVTVYWVSGRLAGFEIRASLGD